MKKNGDKENLEIPLRGPIEALQKKVVKGQRQRMLKVTRKK